MVKFGWHVVLALALAGLVAACSSAPPPAPTAKPAAPAPAVAPAAAAQPSAAARQPVQLRALLSTFGASGYNMGFALSELAKKNHPWIRISPGETPGGLYNMKAMENPSLWDNTIAITTTILIQLAAKGDPLAGGEQITGLRGLFSTTGADIHLVTLDPNIKTPADLRGKRIALGLKSQITWGPLAAMTLEHGWDVTEKNSNIQYVGPTPAKNALMDNRVDAAITGVYLNPSKGYAPATQLVELAASPRPIYHIPWGKAETEATIKKTGIPLIPTTIPAGALPDIKQDLHTWIDVTAFCAKDTFSEEYAYEIVKLAAQQAAKFAEYDALGKLISPDFLPTGWTKRTLHPGALRAYQELGIKVAD